MIKRFSKRNIFEALLDSSKGHLELKTPSERKSKNPLSTHSKRRGSNSGKDTPAKKRKTFRESFSEMRKTFRSDET